MGAVKISTVFANGAETEYFTFGDGDRPLIIIPGVSIKPAAFSADAVAVGFADYCEKYRVYVFDRRKNLRYGCTVGDMADDIAGAMQTLGIKDADIFGASQGGMITLLIAARYPSLVHKIVLGSTNYRQNDYSRAVFSDWIRLAEEGRAETLNHAVIEKVYSKEYRARYAEAFSQFEKEGTPGEIRRFAAMVNACLIFDASDEIGNVRCPALAIGSSADEVVTVEGTYEIAEKLGCEVFVYDGYSHAVYDEAPDYRAKMLEYLQRN